MKATEFKDWIKSIERMSRGQRDISVEKD